MEKQIIRFIGVLVQCNDLDSRDEYIIEVSLNERLFESGMEIKKEQAIEKAAMKHDIVSMTGNAFSFEELNKSGLVIQKTIILENLSDTTEAAQETINESYIG